MYDAANGSGVKFAIINEGLCTSNALDQTVFDGVRDVLDWVIDARCVRCCARLTHEGDWAATIKIVSDRDRIDPGMFNCEKKTNIIASGMRMGLKLDVLYGQIMMSSSSRACVCTLLNVTY